MTGTDPMTLDRLFSEQAKRTPERPAARMRERVLTYREMDALAWRVAHVLSARGAGPGERVGVAVDPGPPRGVAVLAALRTGAAYVPLDPSYPEARLRFMTEDADLAVTLVSPRHAERFGRYGAVLDVEEATRPEHPSAGGGPAEPWATERSEAEPEGAAYLLYTSGSTGRPKGVVMPHRALSNLIRWQIGEPGFDRPLRTLHFAPLGFDVHAQEMFSTWCTGGELVYVDDQVRRDAPRLLSTIAERGIERLFLPFVALQQLVDVALSYGPFPGSLLEVVTAGEQLVVGPSLVDFFERLPTCRLHNQYGPTETHVVTAHTLGEDPTSWPTLPPIGRAIDGARIHLLDGHGEPVPEGGTGELCVAGPCVADGYWRRDDLTRERFVPAPDGDGTMYRTGDLARRDPEGEYHFEGRRDDQVKVRGHRVELGEIEAAIRRHPKVREVVVDATGDARSGRRLTAYLVLGGATLDAVDQGGRDVAPAGARRESLDEWKRVWDGTYTREPAPETGAPDLRGWRSSFTGDPIPVEEMEAWVAGTVEHVRRHEPRRVLEIGCGTGLFVEALAPSCDRYVATDVSEVVLDQLGERIGDRPWREGVELAALPAHRIGEVEGSFDLVLINSVTQHFPDLGYLVRVLRSVVERTAEGGVVIVGDVTNLSLREAFFAHLVGTGASGGTDVDRAKAELERRLAYDEELCIDPDFFRRAREWVPGIDAVDVRLKPGRYDNELSRYRYDVTLRVGGGAAGDGGGPVAEPVRWARWNPARHAPSRLIEEVERDGGPFGVRGIPNARVVEARSWLRALRSEAPATVRAWEEASRSLRREAAASTREPEDFRSIGSADRWEVRVGPGDDPDHFDAVVVPADGERPRWIEQELRGAPGAPFGSLANHPPNVAKVREVAARIRDELEAELPEYMVPRRWTLLARLPRTPSGKVQRSALPPPDRARPDLPNDFVPPEGETERGLARLWAELLELDRVGVTDNFFDLGGNSLLAVRMGVLVRERLDRELPLVLLFGHPTVRSLARALDGTAPADGESGEEIESRARRQRAALARARNPRRPDRHGPRD